MFFLSSLFSLFSLLSSLSHRFFSFLLLLPLFPELELVAESCPAQLVLVLVAPLAALAVEVVQAVLPAPPFLPLFGGG
jgi:hypothetical protein